MIIQNKKTGINYEITREVWERDFIPMQKNFRYKVISNDDPTEPVTIPIEVDEIMKGNEFSKYYDSFTKAQLVEMAKERGLPTNKRNKAGLINELMEDDRK